MKKVSTGAYNLIKSVLAESFVNVMVYEKKSDDNQVEFIIDSNSAEALTVKTARMIAKEILAAAMVAETLNEIGLIRDRKTEDSLDTDEKYDEVKNRLAHYIKQSNNIAIKQLIMEL